MAGNFIGTDATGSADLGNGRYGVNVSGAAGNTIGGTAGGARNVISGNDAEGVRIQGVGATGNLVAGNSIGTDATGTADLGNAVDGVFLASAGNTVGGTAAGAGNVISGNDGNGVVLVAGATGNVVPGTSSAPTRPAPPPWATPPTASSSAGPGQHDRRDGHRRPEPHLRQRTGRCLTPRARHDGQCDPGQLIGTDIDRHRRPGQWTGGYLSLRRHRGQHGRRHGPRAGQLISGNAEAGIELLGAGTTGNVIQGNTIGLNAAGTAPLGNGLAGVNILAAPPAT